MNPCIAVIGLGYWGKNLVRNYYQLGALKLICDKNETVLESYKNQYPEVQTCLALNEVLSGEDIKCVVIATPAESHYLLAREALMSGKHVYVEKPLVLDETEAKDLIELADLYHRTLMVGHLLQYHPVFIRLKELTKDGELGRINYIYSNRLNLGKIRREENILWSFAPHDISMILTLAGEEPETVYATGGNYLHRKIADVTTTHLEFPSGLRAHIFVSWLHPFKEQKLVVVGDRKMAVFNDTEPWPDKLLLYPHRIDWQNNIPVPNKADAERVEVSPAEPLRKECEHFIDCVSNGNRPITDGSEGLRVLRILNASQLSLDSNGFKIELTQGNSKSLPENGNDRLKLKHAMTGDHDIISFAAAANAKVRERPRFSVADKKTYPEAFIHESAYIDDNVEIGSDSKIWHFCHILSGSKIGERCNIGQNVVIGPGVTIGKRCKIQNNVSIYKGVTLEDSVFCGPSMVFTNVYNPRAGIKKMAQVRPTLVKKGVTIGANATIICGVTLGKYSFVGAGAVVSRNVPDYALFVGNPAKQIGCMCECGERLTDELECTSCPKKYEQTPAGLISLKL